MNSGSLAQSQTLDGFNARVFVAGWLAFSGLCVPYFGRAFSVLGLHNRMLGFLFISCAIVVGLRKEKFCHSAVLVLFFVVLHFLLLFAYANPEQIQRVLALSTEDTPYMETKLSKTLIFNILPVMMGLLLSRLATRSAFRKGVVAAMVTWTLVALIVGALNSSYWFSSASDSMEEWGSLYRFSTMGMTLILMGGFLTGLVHFLHGSRRTLSFLLLLSTFMLLVVYLQRAAWIYSLLASLFLVGQTAIVKSSAGLKAALGAVVVFLFGILIANEIGAITVGVWGRAEGILSGDLFDSRAPLFLAAIRGFWENFLGYGLGSFATVARRELYPHNVLLEALYELGLVGGIIMFSILALLLRNILRLIRRADLTLPSLIIGLYLGYVLVYSLKSSDLSSTDLFLSVTLLFSCPRTPPPIRWEA